MALFTAIDQVHEGNTSVRYSVNVFGKNLKRGDETHIFFCGMAIGRRDPAAPINTFGVSRAPLDEAVKFAGF